MLSHHTYLFVLPVKCKFPSIMVKENPHPNSGLPLAGTVKNGEGFHIVPFQANKIVFQFPGSWNKTGGSWVKNKGLCYLWHTRQHDLHILTHSPCSPSPTGDAKHTVDWHHSWGTMSLGNHQFLQGGCLQTCSNFALERNIIFIILDSNQMFPLTLRDTLSSKTARLNR